MKPQLFVLVCVVVSEAKEFGGGWGGSGGWGGGLGKFEKLKLLKGLKEMGGGWGSGGGWGGSEGLGKLEKLKMLKGLKELGGGWGSGGGWSGGGGGWGNPGLGSALGLVSHALNNGWSGGRGSFYFTHRPSGAYPLLGGTPTVRVQSLPYFRNMAQNSHDYHNHGLGLTSQVPGYSSPSYQAPSRPAYQPSFTDYSPSSPPSSYSARAPVTMPYTLSSVSSPAPAAQYSPPQAPPVYESSYESSAPASSPYAASSNIVPTTVNTVHVSIPKNPEPFPNFHVHVGSTTEM